MTRTWRMGTRGSDLALTQSRTVAKALEARVGAPVEVVIIQTRGDAVTDRPLRTVGGKGLFTKEIEDAMLAGDVDFAVHSMKDMPTEMPRGLCIAGIPQRRDPRDALLGSPLDELAHGAVVGTGSARRAMQLRALRPDLRIEGIRGNVDTRIRKLHDGVYDAILLACAGLERLALDVVRYPIAIDQVVPAVGQGALAVQCRESDSELREHLTALSDPDTVDAVAFERAFLIAIDGGCSIPAGCIAELDGNDIVARAYLANDAGDAVRETVRVPRSEAAHAGRALGLRLRAHLAG